MFCTHGSGGASGGKTFQKYATQHDIIMVMPTMSGWDRSGNFESRSENINFSKYDIIPLVYKYMARQLMRDVGSGPFEGGSDDVTIVP